MAKRRDPNNRPLTGEFVTEGSILAVPLEFPGQSVAPPAGETAITCLAQDPRRTVYLGTCGRAAHLMSAMFKGDAGVIFDCGVAPGADRIDALAVHDQHVYAVAGGPDGAALWRWPTMARGFLIQEWTIKRNEPEKVLDLGSQRIACAVSAPGGDVLFGLTEPPAMPARHRHGVEPEPVEGGELFRLDLNDPKLEIIEQLNELGRVGRRIVVDGSGVVWGTRGRGMIWRYDPATGETEDVATVPAAAGRAQHTSVGAWTVDPVTGDIYGGSLPDGFLFRLDPATGETTALGKPTRCDEIHCLTVGHDGRVFGVAGGDDDIGHLFCYEPQRGSLRDLGIPVSTLTVRQYGYVFHAALTGPDGEIYLGQHERVNFLWIYYPPVPQRTPIETPRT